PGTRWSCAWTSAWSVVWSWRLVTRGARRTGEEASRFFQILRRVDAERRRIDDGDVDAHAGLERAELLQLLTFFESRGGELDEALERGAPIGVKPDVMIERPLTRGRGGAGEIERAQAPPAEGRADDLHDVRVGALGRIADLGRDGGDVHFCIGERAERGADIGGIERRQVALHVDHRGDAPLG